MADIRIGRIVDDIWQGILDRINGTEGKVQAEDTVLQEKVDTLNAKDFATSAKQDSIKAALDTLNTKDLPTATKQEAIRLLVDTLSKNDFATQATLEVVQSELALIKSELDNIKQNQTSGDQKVTLSGTIIAHGAKISPVLHIEPGASITLPSCPNIKGYVAIVIGSYAGSMPRLRVGLECSIDNTWDTYGHISTQTFTEFENTRSNYIFRTKTDGKLYGGYHRLRLTNISSTDTLPIGSWSTLQVSTPRSEGL